MIVRQEGSDAKKVVDREVSGMWRGYGSENAGIISQRLEELSRSGHRMQ
jgi:hypothetical protein